MSYMNYIHLASVLFAIGGATALLPDGSISELSINKVLAARDQVTVPTRYVELEERTEDAIEEGGAR